MSQSEESPEQQVERLIRDDNDEDFAHFLKCHHQNSGSGKVVFCSTEILKSICLHRAVKCAAALLDGRTGLCVDLTVPLEGGLSALGLTARTLSYRLVKTFFEHGAKMPSNGDITVHPLNVGLEAICTDQRVLDWNPTKSIYKLFYIFCLPEMNDQFRTLKLLASKTPKKKLEAFSEHCLKESEVVKLAALMIAAQRQLVNPYYENVGLEGSLMWQYFVKEMKKLDDEISTIACDKSQTQLSELLMNKKTRLTEMGGVLAILWRSVDIIGYYRSCYRPKFVDAHEVPFDVAYLLWYEADLDLGPTDVFSDDINCLRAKLKPKEEARLNKLLKKELSKRSSSSRKVGVRLQPSTENEKLNTRAAVPACSVPMSVSSRSRSAHRLLHTCQVKQEGNQLRGVVSPRLLSSVKICGRLLLAAKRIIK